MELIKPKRLKHGDEVSAVSLSSGIIGEKSSSHQKEILESNLEELGLKVNYTKHILSGLEFIRQRIFASYLSKDL